MAFQKPQGSQVDIQSIAEDIKNDPTAIGSIADGVTSDPGAVATLDADYVRRDGTTALTANMDAGGFAITNVGNVDGRDVSTDGSTLDSHVGDGTIHYAMASISITESQISDLQTYAHLVGSPGVVPDAEISESSVTQHEAALTVTEAQISDLQNYAVLVGSPAVVADANISSSSVTQHEAALTVTESQISDLDKYTQAEVDAALAGKADLVGSPAGVVPDAQISSSSVTQHEGDLTITKSQVSDFTHTHSIEDLTEVGSPVAGEVMIGSGSPAAWIQRALATGDVSGLDSALAGKLEWVAAPASATATGTAGEIAYGGDGGSPETFYLYLCVATDTWVRVALASW